jgi:hypothetical protein
VGMGFLGTPLAGDDRKTPDGQRVSVYENLLLSGQDIAFSPGLDVGLRLRYTPWRDLGVSFLAGIHVTTFVGYQGPVYTQRDLTSVGGSLGVSFSPP